MASNGIGLTSPEVMRRLKSLVKVPRYLCVVTVDGLPLHVAMFTDPAEAADWASAKDVQAIYKPLANEGDGHFVRMTLHVVKDEDEPGLPPSFATMGAAIETWATPGKRPADVAPVAKMDDATEKKVQKQANADVKAARSKPTAKAATTKKATSTTAKKPTTRKPAVKKPVAKTAAAKTTTRRKTAK